MSLLLLLREYATADPPVVASTGAVARWSGDSGSVAYPSGIASDDLLVLGVVNKFPTNGPSTPSGWTLQAQSVGGSGTNGDNSGEVYVSWFTKEASGSESGSLTVTTTGATTAFAFISHIITGTAPFDLVGESGTDSTDYGLGVATQTVVSDAALGIEANDLVLVLNGHNHTSGTDPSDQALSAAGATFSTGVELVDVEGDDGAFNGIFQRISASSHACTAGSSSGVATFTCTNGLWYVLRGGAAFLRIRSASGEGPGVVTGTLAATLGALTGSSAGVVAVQGSAAQTLGALTGSAAGVVPVVGSADQTLGALTGASTGVVGSPPITGTLAATLGALTGSSSGVVPVVGSAASTLGALTGSSSGVVPVRGTLAATLGGLTGLASGVVLVRGSASATLGALTGSSSGAVRVAGAASVTLGALTGASTGVVGSPPITGTLAATLGALTGSSSGVVPVVGSAASTLGALTGSSSGVVPVRGTLAATLGGLTGLASGVVPVRATLSATLGALTGVASGVVPVFGSLAQTLGALTGSATGEITDFEPVFFDLVVWASSGVALDLAPSNDGNELVVAFASSSLKIDVG